MGLTLPRISSFTLDAFNVCCRKCSECIARGVSERASDAVAPLLNGLWRRAVRAGAHA